MSVPGHRRKASTALPLSALPLVRALIDGADPRTPNRDGSTPLLLATRNSGRGGSGSPEAKAQQKEILSLLMEHGVN